MVQQSTEYFERCHAADLDPRRTVEQRQACWSAWLEHYAGFQSADRAGYAQERLAALGRGEAMPQLPGLEAAGASVNAAAMVSVGYEPRRGADLPRDAQAAMAAPAPSTLDADPCVRVCAPRQAACVARCDAERGECVTACAAEHRVCLRACY